MTTSPDNAGPRPTRSEPATAHLDLEATGVGSVFVSNYPPYSVWSDQEEDLEAAHRAFASAPRPNTPLGLYLHIPFCRKRCKFCYFRVYTDKNAEQIQRYLEALGTEVERWAETAAVRDRPLNYVYFGGGTPSYIAVKQLLPLVERLKAALPWNRTEEIAFECEPGTLTQSKLEALREIGVTRLSVGIENFNDRILEENGRAHLTREIDRVKPWLEALDFPQVNIDLIAGMVGESWETWKETVQKTIDWDPDSVTIYQMELPFNTVYSKDKLRGDSGLEFADWSTKRAWHAYAIEELEKAGFEKWSAYTLLRRDRDCRFVYTEKLWRGADMIGAGVSSFGHMSGVHFQNADRFGDYLERIETRTEQALGGMAVRRAFKMSLREQLTRELILQLKYGVIDPRYFQDKFASDVVLEWRSQWEELEAEGLLTFGEDEIRLTPGGLLRVDQLLPAFYDEKYQGARYT